MKTLPIVRFEISTKCEITLTHSRKRPLFKIVCPFLLSRISPFEILLTLT